MPRQVHSRWSPLSTVTWHQERKRERRPIRKSKHPKESLQSAEDARGKSQAKSPARSPPKEKVPRGESSFLGVQIFCSRVNENAREDPSESQNTQRKVLSRQKTLEGSRQQSPQLVVPRRKKYPEVSRLSYGYKSFVVVRTSCMVPCRKSDLLRFHACMSAEKDALSRAEKKQMRFLWTLNLVSLTLVRAIRSTGQPEMTNFSLPPHRLHSYM